jgi:hypothetical protein
MANVKYRVITHLTRRLGCRSMGRYKHPGGGGGNMLCNYINRQAHTLPRIPGVVQTVQMTDLMISAVAGIENSKFSSIITQRV